MLQHADVRTKNISCMSVNLDPVFLGQKLEPVAREYASFIQNLKWDFSTFSWQQNFTMLTWDNRWQLGRACLSMDDRHKNGKKVFGDALQLSENKKVETILKWIRNKEDSCRYKDVFIQGEVLGLGALEKHCPWTSTNTETLSILQHWVALLHFSSMPLPKGMFGLRAWGGEGTPPRAAFFD